MIPWWLSGKESTYQCKRGRFHPWVRNIPWRRKWQTTSVFFGLPSWLSSKESTCQYRRCGFDPWVEKIPWSRKWQPTPVFLPGKFHGQRSLADWSPWGRNYSDVTEKLSTIFYNSAIILSYWVLNQLSYRKNRARLLWASSYHILSIDQHIISFYVCFSFQTLYLIHIFIH